MAESLNMKHKNFASMKSIIFILIVLLTIFIPLSSIRVDDTLMGGSGSKIMPRKSKDIRMTYEKVVVRMGTYNTSIADLLKSAGTK